MRDDIAVRIDTDGTVTTLESNNYAWCCDEVGGWAEQLITDGGLDIWANEERHTLGLPPNHIAYFLWSCVDSSANLIWGWRVQGPCVVTGPVDEWEKPTPLPDWFWDVLAVAVLLDANRHP